jgi:signal transduction histidine kinase
MRFLSHLAFGILSTIALIICATVVVGVFSLVGKPFVGFSVVEEGLVNPVGLQSWGGVPAGFRMWDRVIAVDGELVFSKDDVLAQAFERPVGSRIVYQVESEDGRVSFVELPTRVFTASDLVKNHSSLAMLGLVFVIVAVLLYFLRPATAEAWSFFGLFAALGIAMCSVVDLTLLWSLPPLFPIVGPFLGTLGIVLVGVLTRAYTTWDGARFVEGAPEAGETGFRLDDEERRPARRMWALTIISLAVSTIIVLLVLNKGDIHKYVIIDSLFYTWLFMQTAIGLGLLALSYARGRSPRRRARIRQILWAWPVGAGVPMLNLFMGHVLQLSPMSMIWNGFLLLVPISTADAIVRHDLLRLNHTARRIVGGLTVAAVVGIALGLALWSAIQFLELNDAPAMVALAALLFAIAAPITHRVQTHVEDLLRSRRYDAGRLVAEFTTRASTSTHLPDVLAQLKTTFGASIGPASFELYRLERSTHRLTPQVGTRIVDVDATLDQWLARAEPLVVDEDVPAPQSLKGTALAVRLAVANEPVGLLVVSSRPEGTPYEDNDVSFVGALAGPLAAALVNTLAFEAVERLNRELEARVAARTAELERTNSELALMNTRKDDLVATISHDFRSPLAVIRQNVQTILRDLPRMERDDLTMFLEGITRQEARLTALCTNLLDLARLKQKTAPQEPVDVADTARRLVGELQVRATAAGVTLACTVDDDAPTIVRGDPDRLGQVMQNLVDNALKFTPRAGRVDVRLALAADGARLALTVADTGCGVPADALPRLFEPFFQVPTNAHAGQGSGLGLAIVKAVVDAHGGEVRVESREAPHESPGTTFTVLLPGHKSGDTGDRGDRGDRGGGSPLVTGAAAHTRTAAE